MARSKTEARPKAEANAEAKPGRRRVTRRKAVEQHVRSYFDAIAGRDPHAIARHWRADGVEDVVPVGVMRGRDEIARYFREIFTAVPDAETTLTRVVAGESMAAVEWRMRGGFNGAPFRGIEPTGRRVDVRGLDLIEVEDGAIASDTVYYDGAAFARQLGMLPAEGSGAERAMKGALNAVTKVRRAVADRTGG
jgi:steroid delta-isomerase-like uncharacterized protein